MASIDNIWSVEHIGDKLYDQSKKLTDNAVDNSINTVTNLEIFKEQQKTNKILIRIGSVLTGVLIGVIVELIKLFFED